MKSSPNHWPTRNLSFYSKTSSSLKKFSPTELKQATNHDFSLLGKVWREKYLMAEANQSAACRALGGARCCGGPGMAPTVN